MVHGHAVSDFPGAGGVCGAVLHVCFEAGAVGAVGSRRDPVHHDGVLDRRLADICHNPLSCDGEENVQNVDPIGGDWLRIVE